MFKAILLGTTIGLIIWTATLLLALDRTQADLDLALYIIQKQNVLIGELVK